VRAYKYTCVYSNQYVGKTTRVLICRGGHKSILSNWGMFLFNQKRTYRSLSKPSHAENNVLARTGVRPAARRIWSDRLSAAATRLQVHTATRRPSPSSDTAQRLHLVLLTSRACLRALVPACLLHACNTRAPTAADYSFADYCAVRAACQRPAIDAHTESSLIGAQW
jgi:hypothetical protein